MAGKNGSKSTTTTLVIAKPARQAPKKKKKKNRKNRKNKGGGQKNHTMTTAICALTDPFCVAAYGAKYPDSTSMRTLALPFLQFATVGSNAGGQAALLLSHAGFRAATTFVGNAVTVWGAFVPWNDLTTFDAQSARCTSFGFKVEPITGMMTSQGVAGAIVINDSSDTYTYPASLSYDDMNMGQNVRFPMVQPKGFCVTGSQDSVNSKDFIEVTSLSAPAAGTMPAYGNSPIVLYWSGVVASSPIATVTAVAHFEMSFSNSSVLSRAATSAPVDNPALKAGVSAVKHRMSNIVAGGAEAVSAVVHNLATQAMKGAAVSAASYFGGPAAGAMVGHQLYGGPEIMMLQ